MLVGSEGTLAVITDATVRLRPTPAATSTIAAYFATTKGAADAAFAITAAGLQPVICDLLDIMCLQALDAAENTHLSERGEAFLLVQTDGPGSMDEARMMDKILQPLSEDVQFSQDPAIGDTLVRVRRNALPALERLGRVLIEDMAVLRSQLGAMISEGRAHCTHP